MPEKHQWLLEYRRLPTNLPPQFFIKLITKLLSQRLQEVIIHLIHENRYGFIKSRTIHDCLAWVLESISICKKTKKEMVIIKLDFGKAFDRVEHEAILKILQTKGSHEMDQLDKRYFRIRHLYYFS